MKRVARVAGAVLAALLLANGLSSPAVAEPSDLDKAKEQVKALETQASEIDEDYDEAKIALADGKKKVKALNADIAKQQQVVDSLSDQVRQIALLEFQGRGVDTTVQIFTNPDPDSLLSQLSTATKIDENMNATLQEHQSAAASLIDMKRTLASEVEALSAEEQRLSTLETEVKSKLQQAKNLVTELTASQLAAMYADDGGSASFDPSELDGADANAKALAAVKYAVSKVGNSQYVWGAAGPNSFDCSGLMLAAYRSVGVSLPHSSRAQAGIGRAVSRDELKPGDLIFWYSPIHHVGMYIGNGKIVHARNTRSDLVIQTLASYPAPYSGARRILG
jgi:cell wall-associated NlpC family hydrolase